MTAAVKIVPSSFFSERMHEQLTLERTAWSDEPPHGIEVLARLLLVPRRRPGRQGLQVADAAPAAMAHEASGVTRALLQKDGLHVGLEELVVQRHAFFESG